MAYQSIPEQTVVPQFATYQEAVATIPADAEWSSSFGDHVVGCDVYFRCGNRRWIVSSKNPRFSGWTVRVEG